MQFQGYTNLIWLKNVKFVLYFQPRRVQAAANFSILFAFIDRICQSQVQSSSLLFANFPKNSKLLDKDCDSSVNSFLPDGWNNTCHFYSFSHHISQSLCAGANLSCSQCKQQFTLLPQILKEYEQRWWIHTALAHVSLTPVTHFVIYEMHNQQMDEIAPSPIRHHADFISVPQNAFNEHWKNSMSMRSFQ